MILKAIADFLVSLEANGRSPRTIDTYEHRLLSFQKFMETVGILDLDMIGPGDLDAWAASLRHVERKWTDHPYRQTEAGHLSEATIVGRIGAVKTWLAWCVDRGYLEVSPARHLRRSQPRPSVRDKVIDPEDLRLMIEEAQRRAVAGNPRDWALLAFMVDTACRLGEVARLRLDHLDLERREALITGKTGERYVDFGETAAGALAAWLEVRPDVDHDVAFTSLNTSEPLTTDGIYHMLRRIAEAAGVEGRFNPQSIRHFMGQRFTDESNLELARQKLGHRNIKTTANHYAHQDRERVKRATQRLSFLNQEHG